jgi:hypothetical protein
MDIEYMQLLTDREVLLQCKYAFDLLGYHQSYDPLKYHPEIIEKYDLLCLKVRIDAIINLFRTTSCHLRFFRLKGELLLFLADHEEQIATFNTALLKWKYPEVLTDRDFVFHASKHLETLLKFCSKGLEKRSGVKELPEVKVVPQTTATLMPTIISKIQRYATIIIADGYHRFYPF